MSRLYLHCELCSRKQADGIISGAAWGRMELPDHLYAQHPTLIGKTLRACPTCIGRHPDWQDRILQALGSGAGFGPVPGLTR
jgi:hypothetical protein